MGIDDFLKQVEEDERADRLEEQRKATPIDYARMVARQTGQSFPPQKVYYNIRNKKLALEDCICGRHVIDIETANKLFGLKKETGDNDEDV